MIVVENVGLKKKIEPYIQNIWGEEAPFLIFDDSENWEREVKLNEKISFIQNADKFDKNIIVNKFKDDRFKDLLPTFRFYVALIIDEPLKTEIVSEEFPIFLFSRNRRKIGNLGRCLRFQENELILQLLSWINILSSGNEGPSLFNPKETNIILSCGWIFPEKAVMKTCLSIGLRESIGEEALDLIGLDNFLKETEDRIKKDFDREYIDGVFGCPKDFPTASLLIRQKWENYQKLFSLDYLKNQIAEAKNVWSLQVKKLIVKQYKKIAEAIGTFEKFLENFFTIDHPLVMFNYTTPWESASSDVRKSLDEFQTGPWEKWRDRRKKLFIHVGITLLLTLVSFLSLKNMWIFAIAFIVLSCLGVFEYLIPLERYKKNYSTLSEKIRDLCRKLSVRYRESNIGWVDAHYAGYLTDLKTEFLNLKSNLEKKASDLEPTEISFPEGWEKLSPENPYRFIVTLEELLSAEFSVDNSLKVREKEARAHFDNLEGFYGKNIDEVSAFVKSSAQYLTSEMMAKVFSSELENKFENKIEHRTVKSIVIFGPQNILSQLAVSPRIESVTSIDEKRAIYILLIETIRQSGRS